MNIVVFTQQAKSYCNSFLNTSVVKEVFIALMPHKNCRKKEVIVVMAGGVVLKEMTQGVYLSTINHPSSTVTVHVSVR